MFVVCVFEGEDFVRGKNVVVRTRWTVDIGVDSLAVEHLTSDAGVPASISGTAINFHFCVFLYLTIPPVFTTFGALAFPVQ